MANIAMDQALPGALWLAQNLTSCRLSDADNEPIPSIPVIGLCAYNNRQAVKVE